MVLGHQCPDARTLGSLFCENDGPVILAFLILPSLNGSLFPVCMILLPLSLSPGASAGTKTASCSFEWSCDQQGPHTYMRMCMKDRMDFCLHQTGSMLFSEKDFIKNSLCPASRWPGVPWEHGPLLGLWTLAQVAALTWCPCGLPSSKGPSLTNSVPRPSLCPIQLQF